MVSCQKDADVKNYGHMLCTLCVLACVWCDTVHLCVGCDSRDPAAFWSDSLRVEGDLASACVPARVPLRTPQSLHRVDCQCGCGLNGGDMVRKELGGLGEYVSAQLYALPWQLCTCGCVLQWLLKRTRWGSHESTDVAMVP